LSADAFGEQPTCSTVFSMSLMCHVKSVCVQCRYEKLQGKCLDEKVVTEIRLVTCPLMLSASSQHAAQFLACH
jgi:hypothetical protein